MDEQRKPDEPQGTEGNQGTEADEQERALIGVPVGMRQRCPYCGSVSYELVVEANHTERRCTDCGTVYPAGSGA